MHKVILAVALSLNTKSNAICAVSLVRGFCRKKSSEPPLKHLKQLPWKPKFVMTCSQLRMQAAEGARCIVLTAPLCLAVEQDAMPARLSKKK